MNIKPRAAKVGTLTKDRMSPIYNHNVPTALGAVLLIDGALPQITLPSLSAFLPVFEIVPSC